MSTTATPMVNTNDHAFAVEKELRDNPEGTTARKIASKIKIGLREVNEVLTAMEIAGVATRTHGEATGNGRKGADVWRFNTTDATPARDEAPTDDTEGDATPATDEAPADDDTDSDATPAEAPVSAVPVSAVPVSGAPTSGAPTGTPDLKIVMVAGVLGDHPDGVSAADVVNESGLRSAIVARALASMEAAGAAVRTPATEPGGADLWTRGEADLVGISVTAAPTWCECTCGNRHRLRNTVSVSRTGTTTPGQNADGGRMLGKNELRNMVRDFLASHRGHEFTAGVISREIGRSSGAISNALAKLVISGEATLVRETPMTYTAPAAAADEAPAGK